VAKVPTTFASDFRRHVAPILRTATTAFGEDLSDDRLTFPEAMAELQTLAYARGAGFLPEHVRDELTNWLGSNLLNAACLAEDANALVERLRREPDRAVMRNAIRAFLHGQ
jgi:hypothetical protein